MEARKEKGLHAARQLHAGASLFSTRIALQKAVAPITTLTPTTTLKEHDETHAEEAKHKLTRLAWHIAQLQQEMLDALAPSSEAENDNKNEEDEEQDKNDKDEDEDDDANESDEDEDRDEDETGERKSKKAKRLTTPFTVIEDEDAQLAAMEAACRRHHDRLMPYISKTVDKWHMKTRLAAGKNKGFKALNESLMVQIKDVARDKMRAHTTEKYDDTSFYLVMLREHLENRADFMNMNPVEMARHFLELDALRAKVKRKVDTRASKGRKLRFHVHPKLVNFMAPDDTAYATETSEHAKQALFASLFKNE